MTTECYAMVRGSAVRVTALDRKGTIPDNIGFVTSKSVVKVTINEVTESGSSQLLGSDENDNDNRVQLSQSDQLLYYTVDIDFLRVDPYMLSMVAGVPLVYKSLGLDHGVPGYGFDEAGFDEGPFGGASGDYGEGFGGDAFGMDSFGEDGGEASENQEVVGFDSEARRPPVSFALEVWSKLAGESCASTIPDDGFDLLGFDEGAFGGTGGPRRYGYTVFPHLRGGRMSGFEFTNGLVSFNIRGAQTRRSPRWGVGPYDLTGVHERLLTPVSRNTLFRQTLTLAVPPTQVDGLQEFEDVIYGGSATVTTDDVIDGGTAESTTDWTIEGGIAA